MQDVGRVVIVVGVEMGTVVEVGSGDVVAIGRRVAMAVGTAVATGVGGTDEAQPTKKTSSKQNWYFINCHIYTRQPA